MRKIKVGIVGCGAISGIYITNLQKSPLIEVVAVTDIVKERAIQVAQKFNIRKTLTVDEFFLDDEIELVVNLTIPSAHGEVHLKALEAGKHTYGEKPLAADLPTAERILSTAKEKGLLVGCAPDTFLGASFQQAKKILDDGVIGKPIGASAFMMTHGPESFHPRPQFLYQEGAGPLLDMGPYYLTALISLLGPIDSVIGKASKTFEERTITAKENYGETFPVETPTHITSILHFSNGAIGNLTTSFDIWDTTTPKIEIYGTKGTMVLPDPNKYSGELYVRTSDNDEFQIQKLKSGYVTNSRGLGVYDMAHALLTSNTHRASGELAYHVLEVMKGILLSAESEQFIKVQSKSLVIEPFLVDSLIDLTKVERG